VEAPLLEKDVFKRVQESSAQTIEDIPQKRLAKESVLMNLKSLQLQEAEVMFVGIQAQALLLEEEGWQPYLKSAFSQTQCLQERHAM
tara:strand:+ start:257 stop:517 length:261 start_codon:yes stop_codon:yes gene_type:complete